MTILAEEYAIPTRHGADLAEGRRMAASIRRTFAGDGEPSPELWNEIGLGCLRGDPPADRLVAWMAETGMARAYASFERALDAGIGSTDDAPEPLRAFFEVVERRPVWLDDAMVAEGISVCRISGLRGTFTMRDGALMGGYQSSAINQTLILTGSLARGAGKRVAETIRWWDACMDDGGMERFAEGFKSTLRVRVMHALVRAKVSAMPEWSRARFGVPINQTDMALTYLTFSALFLAGQRALGVPLRAAEGAAAMHVWRYIGSLMGVEDRWLRATERDGRILLYQMLLAQAPPDETSVALGRALLDEPLERPIARFPWLRRRFLRAVHLSNTSLFVGSKGLAALGLPRALPWYPLATTPVVFAKHALHRLMPNGRDCLVRAGRREQKAFLASLR